MPEPNDQAGQPDPVVADLLGSINEHPGLQVQVNEDGTEAPANDPAGQNFLAEQTSGQPAPEQQPPAPAAPNQAAPGSVAPSSSGRLFAGKYRSVEEMERAHLIAQQTLREREAENRAIKAVNQHLDEVLTPLRTRPERPEPTAIPVTFDRNNLPVLDPAALDAAIEARARVAAREQVQAVLGPMTAMSRANSQLRNEYPEFAQRDGEFTAWLQAHPEYQERVIQDPEFALEGAYLKFERERGFAVNQQNMQAAQAAQSQVRQARDNASPAGGNPVAQRRGTEQDSVTQRLTALHRHGQETGDWKPYKQARLEMALGAEYLSTLERTTWGR